MFDTPALLSDHSLTLSNREEWIDAIRSIAEQLQVLEENTMDSEEMMDDGRGSKRKKVSKVSIRSEKKQNFFSSVFAPVSQ